MRREFKEAVAEVEEPEWQPLYREQDGRRVKTGQEWAEVCFVPNWVGHSKRGPEYRYLAIREPLRQLELPGMERQRELPFPTLEMNRLVEARRNCQAYQPRTPGSGRKRSSSMISSERLKGNGFFNQSTPCWLAMGLTSQLQFAVAGDPAGQILKFAHARGVDLIAMASRGLSGVLGVLMGRFRAGYSIMPGARS